MRVSEQHGAILDDAISCSSAGGGPFAPLPAIPLHCPNEDMTIDIVTTELFQGTWRRRNRRGLQKADRLD